MELTYHRDVYRKIIDFKITISYHLPNQDYINHITKNEFNVISTLYFQDNKIVKHESYLMYTNPRKFRG